MPEGRIGRADIDPALSATLAPKPGSRVSRVRCVIAFEQRYLLVQHNTRRPESFGKWGLIGGRLKALEDPRTGLRREVREELRFRVPYLIELGDWSCRGETHRVFGCQTWRALDWFDREEILAMDWLSYSDVVRLAETRQLHTGFELAAITDFRNRAAAKEGSIELSRRPSKKVRGSRKARTAAKRAKPATTRC